MNVRVEQLHFVNKHRRHQRRIQDIDSPCHIDYYIREALKRRRDLAEQLLVDKEA